MQRKEILPEWIRAFSWLFLIGAIAPILFVVGFFVGTPITCQACGFSYSGSDVFHPVPILTTVMLTTASIVSIGILREKNWAITLALIYGWLVVLISIASLCYRVYVHHIYIPLELLFLIPFLSALYKRKRAWEEFGQSENETGSNQCMEPTR